MDTLRTFGPGILVAAAGASLVLVHAVRSWATPLSTVWMGLVAVVPLSLFVGLVVNWEAFSRPGTPSLLGGNLVVAVGVALAVPVFWSFPASRAAATGWGDDGVVSVDLMGALGDPSDRVRAAACRELLGRAHLPTRLVSKLASNPSFALSCLKRGRDEPSAGRLASSLAGQWRDELVYDADANEQECGRAEALAELPIEAQERATKLLHCAVGGEKAAVRSCCAKIAADRWGTCGPLVGSVDRDELAGRGMAGVLVGASFGATATREHLGEVVGRLELACEPMRRASLEMLCEVGPTRSASTRDVRYLEWVRQHFTDCLEDPQAEVDGRLKRFCREVEAAIEEGREVDATLVCRAQKAARKAALARRERRTAGGRDLDEVAASVTRASPAAPGGEKPGRMMQMASRMVAQGEQATRCQSPRDVIGAIRDELGGGGETLFVGHALEQVEKGTEGVKVAVDKADFVETAGEDARSFEQLEDSEQMLEKMKGSLERRGSSQASTNRFVRCMRSDTPSCALPMDWREGRADRSECRGKGGAAVGGVEGFENFADRLEDSVQGYPDPEGAEGRSEGR